MSSRSEVIEIAFTPVTVIKDIFTLSMQIWFHLQSKSNVIFKHTRKVTYSAKLTAQMSEPAVFDQNVVDSWFFHRWKEQSLSFINYVLTNLFDEFKGFKIEF
jgi:uncharacterized PurR-regulated membrane protein YhhQ (DUF165 family)